MSTTAEATESPKATTGTGAALDPKLDNQSIENFAASLSTAAVIFGVQIAIFLILSGNWKLHKTRRNTDASTERQSLFHKI